MNEDLKSYVKVTLSKSSTSGKEGYSIDVCAAKQDLDKMESAPGTDSKYSSQEKILTKLAENALQTALRVRQKLL